MKRALLILLMLALVATLVLWWSPDLRRQAAGLLHDTGLTATATTLYKWQDSRGTWQYTQEPPAQGIAYQKIETTSDVNVLPLPPQLQPRQ